LQLAGAQLDAERVRGRLREVVAARFEALAPQAQAVPAPVKHLDAVGGAVAEDEQVAGKRVGLEPGADEVEQAVEAEAHVNGVGAIPQFDGGREAQHGSPPRAPTTERTKSRSQPGPRRRTQPLGRATSTDAAGGSRRTGSRRGWSASGTWGWSLFFQ